MSDIIALMFAGLSFIFFIIFFILQQQIRKTEREMDYRVKEFIKNEER